MAIVINGSGTVTGISVGGLPDGIVDAGTLATNSVDSAELINGSIDAAHLASGVGVATWELVGSITSTGNTSVTIGGDSSPVFSSSHDTYVLTGLVRTNQDASTGMRIQPILAGAGTTADATGDVQHVAPMMRSNTSTGSTALTYSHQDLWTYYAIDLNYNPMGTGTGEAHAFNMWFYDPFQNASFAHYQLANASVASFDSNAYTSNLNYAYKKATSTAYVGLVLTNIASGGLDYNLSL